MLHHHTGKKRKKHSVGCNPCWSLPAAACNQSHNSVNWHITTNNSGFPWDSLSGLCRLCGKAYNHALLDERNTSWEMDYLIFLVLCQHLNLASHMCVANVNHFMLSRCSGNQGKGLDSDLVLEFAKDNLTPQWWILCKFSTTEAVSQLLIGRF